jgi:uncharacterized protein YggE
LYCSQTHKCAAHCSHPALIIPQFDETDQPPIILISHKRKKYSMTNYKQSLRNFAIIATISMACLASLSIQGALAEPAKPTISVSSTGSASVAPDMAMISLGVQRQARTAREALNMNSTAMADVLAALKAEGIEGKDLQTANFNIQPQYHYFKQPSSGEQRPPEIIGYTVSNQLSVRIRDLAILGEILDLTVTLGVNSGGNIRFMSDNPAPTISKAREMAMKNAIAKAKTLTSAAGVGLGKILTISENSSSPRPMAMQEMAMTRAASAPAVPVASGENSYSVSVQVSWEIKQ